MPQVGYRIIGTVKEVKGKCNAGHKVGDKIELDGHDLGGLCGFFIMISFLILSCFNSGVLFLIPELKIQML